MLTKSDMGGVCSLTNNVLRAATTLVVGLIAAAGANAADWPSFGQNPANTATSASETAISNQNVSTLKPKWVFSTQGDVSARAAVVSGVAYFPDWGGNLWAVNASNGNLVWGHKLTDYGLPANTQVRTTPAVAYGIVYVGTQSGAYLLAISASTGKLIWKSQLESSDPYAIISSSPVVVGTHVYAGVASLAEGATAYGITIVPGAARGSVVCVNAASGAMIWKTYMTPAGYSGAGVWGSNPVADVLRGTLYVGTGNNYSHPAASAVSSNPNLTYGQCIAAGGTAATCNSPDDHEDSIVALNLATGAVKWATRLVDWNQYGVTSGSDDWNVDCIIANTTQCPSNPGPDFDFGSAPNEITYNTATGPKTIIGAGQKSGVYYALNPDTGALLWRTQVGPGSALGGMEWGSASDGQRIYVAIANLYGIPYSSGSAGSWAALDPATGAIVWQTADPNGSIDIGPVAAVNGVVYASSMAGSATAPTMFALDARTGATLWSYAAGSSVNAGASIANGTVYWGSGYTHLGIPGFTGNNRFYAFSLGGN